jgi:hypothetical protein
VDLIVDNQLDGNALKAMFGSIAWTILPRNLGPNHSEYFYTGHYSDEVKEIKIILRPSLTMSVTESFKNRMSQNGAVPPPEYRGLLVDWGQYVEVQVPASFLQNVIAVAKPLATKQKQKIEW